MQIIWTNRAYLQRESIFDFIAQDNPQAAITLDELFESQIAKLSRFPNIGKSGRVPDTYELVVHQHYIVVYEIIEGTIYILALLHSSMQYPNLNLQ